MPDQRYEVGTDGRAPRELRQAFSELVLDGAATAGDAPAGAELARRLLTCTTSLPAAVIDALGLPPGSSYALAAEQLHLRQDPAAAEHAHERAWEAWRASAASAGARMTAASDLLGAPAADLPWRR